MRTMKKDTYFVHLTPELIESAQKRLDFISSEGSTANGVDETIDPTIRPDWYDEQRFRKGQQLAQKHYAATFNSALIGLLMFLQLPVGLVTILATGKSRNLGRIFERYCNTFQFVEEWIKFDLFDPTSKAYRALTMVRSMHKNANKMMNQKTSVYEFARRVLAGQLPKADELEVEKYVRSRNRVWVSMYDMALIQWAFMGIAALEPEASGFHGITKEEFEHILFVWRVISYKLGISEQYSIIGDCNYDHFYAISKLILEQEYIPHMTNRTFLGVHKENCAAPTGTRMGKGVLIIMENLTIGPNWNVYLRYWYKNLNINSSKLNRQGVESDQMRLVEISRKNQLSEEERQKMLSNGFNEKYIVQDYSTPFEAIPLNGLKEMVLNWAYLLLVCVLLRFDLGKWIANMVAEGLTLRARSIRKRKVMELEKLSVKKRMEFSECPFVGSISTTSVDPALREVEKLFDLSKEKRSLIV